MLLALVGPPGSYKTTFLTALAYDAYLDGKDVMSNYTLRFDRPRGAGKVIPLNLSLLGLEEGGMESVFVALDEIHVWFDAKRHMSQENIDGSHILLQARKRECDVAGTSQSFRYVEGRFRTNCDILFLMKRPYPDKEIAWAYAYDPRAMRRILRDPIEFNPRPVYPLFDTHERMKKAPPPTIPAPSSTTSPKVGAA